MELKKVSLAKLRKLVFNCKSSTNNCPSINEVELFIVEENNKKIKPEKIKFIYSGVTKIYRKKKNVKKTNISPDDYEPPILQEKWLEDKKNKQENNDLVYILGLIKYKGDKSYDRSSLQVCDNNYISINCLEGSMIYANS